MSFNIVDAIQSYVTPDELHKVAAATGESPNKTRQAMSTGILGIVGSVIQRSSSATGAASILSALGGSHFGSIGNLATSLLGDHGDQVTDVVARTSGIGKPAAKGIMAAALPIVATVLGREVTKRNLDAGGLTDFMRSQKDVLSSVPGWGAVAGALGFGSERTEHKAVEAAPVATAPIVERTPKVLPKPKRPWAAIALGLGVLGLGAILLGRRAVDKEPVATAPVAEAPPAAPAPGGPVLEPAAPEPTSETTITAAEVTTTEDDLGKHFAAKDLPDRMTLSDVTFDFATANLKTGQETVEQLTELMKANPGARVRLEGHTDSVGDAKVNAALSLKRAEAVRLMLRDKGIDAKRIDVVGVGERRPVTSNDTEDGRAKNRRLDAIIIKR